MHVTRLPKLAIVKTMKPVGTSIQKRKDADSSIMADAVETKTTSRTNNRACLAVRSRLSPKLPNQLKRNHSAANIVTCHKRLDHAVPLYHVSTTIRKRVHVTYSLMVGARAIRITSNRKKIARVSVDMYKMHAPYHQSMDNAMKMRPDGIMIDEQTSAQSSCSAVVVEIKTTFTLRMSVDRLVNNVNNQHLLKIHQLIW